MFFPRVKLCLVGTGRPDQFVSIRDRNPGQPAPEIEHEGVRYKKTARKTDGGWRIYKEVVA